MKITYERHGGFAAIPLRLSLDSATMNPTEALHLEGLIRQSNIFDVDEPRGKQGADSFSYTIEVIDGARRRRLTLGDGASDEGIATLINHLTQLARTQRRNR
jgi:emfourin